MYAHANADCHGRWKKPGLVVGIGELGVSMKGGKLLRTVGLGSCVAVLLHHLPSGVIAMAHVALPNAAIDYRMSRSAPAKFADTAVPVLLAAMRQQAPFVGTRKILARLVGGANVVNTHSKTLFDIGQRNVESCRRALMAAGLGVLSEDVGGDVSRSVSFDPDSGQVCIKCVGGASYTLQ